MGRASPRRTSLAKPRICGILGESYEITRAAWLDRRPRRGLGRGQSTRTSSKESRMDVSSFGTCCAVLFSTIPVPGAGAFDVFGVIVAAPSPPLGTASPVRVLSVSSGRTGGFRHTPQGRLAAAEARSGRAFSLCRGAHDPFGALERTVEGAPVPWADGSAPGTSTPLGRSRLVMLFVWPGRGLGLIRCIHPYPRIRGLSGSPPPGSFAQFHWDPEGPDSSAFPEFPRRGESARSSQSARVAREGV
ncbi:hypothetical protein LCGC14_0776390 [marine sediment metagenome]|uniref:Uncharacterized protein n=1 Tax=marine sediment metagenome TaxID=412755 RepID=A0A0F9SGQ5_9ZZZZ